VVFLYLPIGRKCSYISLVVPTLGVKLSSVDLSYLLILLVLLLFVPKVLLL
jgi:hypothetical protein